MRFFWKKGNEVRADTKNSADREEQMLKNMMDSGILLESVLSNERLTKQEAKQIPAVTACIDYIAGTVTSVPIKLYEQGEEGAKELSGDRRVFLLNHDTKDTLTAKQFWRAILEDYYLGNGGYAYINKEWDGFIGIHYVESESVDVVKNEEPIFKDFDIYVYGKRYFPYEFLKFLRKTADGCTSSSVIEENKMVFEVAYQTLAFEKNLVKKGGNKKGFLKSKKKLVKEALEALKEGFKKMYSNNRENVVVLNDGIEFQEASNTSVEMQLNENKEANTGSIASVFKMPPPILTGRATKEDRENYIRFCILPLLEDLECSLDRDLLEEKEKGSRYFAFDTKELTRGNIEERYKAYEIGLKNNFLQIDEVRDKEDMEALGINWIRLGLDSVLFDPKTKEIYTPNTNETKKMDAKTMGEGGEDDAGGNQE